MTSFDINSARDRLIELATSDYLISPGRVIEAIEALQRLDQGEYGVCVNCRKRISRKRLAVRPEALRCVNCQSREEQYLAA